MSFLFFVFKIWNVITQLTVNGNIYDGQWSNGLKHGEGVYVFKDKGQYMDGVWVNGILKLSTIRYIDKPESMRTQYLMPEVSIIEIVIV